MCADDPEVNRVAVRLRAGSAAYTDVAIRSADIFDDDGLTERSPHTLDHNSPGDIRTGACSGRYDHRNRPRRIGLRACNPRDGRERNSTRCQLGKLTARTFHDVPLDECADATQAPRLSPPYRCFAFITSPTLGTPGACRRRA